MHLHVESGIAQLLLEFLSSWAAQMAKTPSFLRAAWAAVFHDGYKGRRYWRRKCGGAVVHVE